MPITLYETLFALDSTRVATDTEATKTVLHGLMEKHGSEIVVARPWDENGKLAYPIDKHKKAYFYIVYYKLESTKQAEMEKDFKLNETILRLLTSRIDPKWADTMLEIARNEAGSRFAHKGMQDDTAPTGEGILSNDPMVMAGRDGGDRGDRGGDRGDGPPRGRGPRREMNDKPE